MFKMSVQCVVIFAVSVIIHTSPLLVWARCSIDVNKDYNISSPLFLSKNTLEIIYPDKTSPKVLSFNPGQEVLIYCSGGMITRYNVSTHTSNEVSSCVRDSTFSNPLKHLQYPFGKISCSKNPVPITKEDPTRKCNNGVVVNIGYQITPIVFRKTIDLCYVKDLATTTWAHTWIPAAIGGNKNREFVSPSFIKGSYFENVLISHVYPKSNQREVFMKIFNNDEALVERYIPKEGEKKNYFVKGHLVARADMFYHPEQWSTYTYINVLPMWQSINNANWKSVESTVRHLAAFEGGLDVWTGGIGVLKLAGHDIFLSHDKHNGKRPLVPVPRLLFKLAHSPTRNVGLAFVTVNDPYIPESEPLPPAYKICNEYKLCSDNFPQFKHTHEGYTYCCLYDDFMDSPAVRELMIPANFANLKPLNLH